MGWYYHTGKQKDNCHLCGKRIKKDEKFYFLSDQPRALAHAICLWQSIEDNKKAGV